MARAWIPKPDSPCPAVFVFRQFAVPPKGPTLALLGFLWEILEMGSTQKTQHARCSLHLSAEWFGSGVAAPCATCGGREVNPPSRPVALGEPNLPLVAQQRLSGPSNLARHSCR